MPYANEHAARLRVPDKYIRFRRENDKFDDGIHAIWGITEDETVELQSIRFDAKKWTPAEAKKWLKDHDYEPLEFEEASGEEDIEDIADPLPRQTAQTRRWYEIRAEGEAPETADIHVYDVIGDWYEGVTAKQFVADLAELPESVKTLRVHVNSPGGNLFDALAIANALRGHRATVEMSIEGLAASAATIVTNGGGDSIQIAHNALVMIHNPFGMAFGTAKEMRSVAEALDRSQTAIIATYQRHSDLGRDELAEMMEAVTWMDADEALANGFATEKVTGLKAAASIDPRAVVTLKIPEKYAERVSALLRPEETPEAIEAAEVVRLCNEADLDLDFAVSLMEPGLPLTAGDVRERIASEKDTRREALVRETTIRALCEAAHQEDLADGYVAGSMTAAQVQDHLTKITAKLDQVEIDTSLRPDHGTTPKPRINVVEVYAERNRLALPAKTKE